MEINRKNINSAWKLYRTYRKWYKEFDFGPVNFFKFLEVEESRFRSYMIGTATLELTILGSKRIEAILNSAPEQHYFMLKVVQVRYGNRPKILIQCPK